MTKTALEPRRTAKRRPRIVVVDDDADFQLVVRQWLNPRWDAIGLLGGPSLAEDVASLEPDLIVLDVGLPGTDGFRVCRSIRARAAMGDVPVLFVTGEDTLEAFLKGFEAGGTAYITKPVGRAQLVSRIDALLGGREA